MSQSDTPRPPFLEPASLGPVSTAPSTSDQRAEGWAPRSPEHSLLHRVVREQLEPFLARARARERPAPHFVEQELRAFLRCGILAQGFLRPRCDECGHDRLVPFSCKRRGFCPSCGGRRMADTAAHLVDRVLPEVPVRQWVLTLPYPLRYRCAYERELASQVLRAFLRALFAEPRQRVRRYWGVRAEQCGAVTFLQRFGSALNLNLHFHTLALDGAYPYPDDEETPRFFALPPPRHDDVVRVLAGTARRIERLLASRAEEDEEDLARDEPLLAALAAASLRTRIADGPEQGEWRRRVGDRVEPGDPHDDPDATPHVPECRGMSLHAAVSVPARDRRRLEQLCRYVARPPLANERSARMAGSCFG
jgi:Transposase zinc-binding domain/Putative transposase